MDLASLLPSPLCFIAGLSIKKDYKSHQKCPSPLLLEGDGPQQSSDVNFLDFILPVIDKDKDAVDVLAIIVFGGLTNLQATMHSTFLGHYQPTWSSRTDPELSRWCCRWRPFFEEVFIVGVFVQCRF